MKYVLLRNGAIDRTKDWGSETPPDLSHKTEPLKWVPEIQEDQPAYDSNREKLEKTITINENDVTYGWTAVALSKDERKAKVDDISASAVQDGLGDITDRLATLTQATLLLDAVNQGLITNDDPSLTPLRDLGAWWQGTQAHAASLKADIDADLDPDITAGWPVAP